MDTLKRLQGQLAMPSLLMLAAAAVMGCNEQSATKTSADADLRSDGFVAVIDLDRVAQELGQDKRISQTLTARQSTLQKQLAELANSYRKQITQKSQAASTQQQGAVQLASFQQEANQKLQAVQQQASRDLATQRAQLIKQFRETIKPYAREVARSRGLGVIVTNNDSVIYDYAASVDITDEVVKSIIRRRRPPH